MTKILIVEDSMIVSFHIKILLESNGYEVVACLTRAEDVEETINLFAPEIILMDVMLDGPMSGIESAIMLRKKNKVPIIFMSALSDVDSLNAIEEIKNTYQLGKPFDDEELLQAIRNANQVLSIPK